MNIDFTEQEKQALEKLCKEKELSEEALIKQALRLYQMVSNNPEVLKIEHMGGCSHAD